jgi:hypothetical protein
MVVALWLSMVGGVVCMVSYFVEIPLVVGLAALAALVFGLGTFVTVAFRTSRSGGASTWLSVGRAVKTGMRWIWDFVP